MPIPREEFRTLDEDDRSPLDRSPDGTRGTVHRFLLDNAERAFRQREIGNAVDLPESDVRQTLERLRRHDLVEYRDGFWAIADAEHAVASAGLHAATTADEVDDGFSDADVDAWMEAAVEPIEDDADTDEKNID